MLSYSEFKAALPSRKRDTDTMWAKIALRPLSQPVAWGLYRLGVSGNAVSFSCVALSIIGVLMLALGTQEVAVVAAVIFNIVGLGDCVDGNIARASKKNGPGGEWVDALAGYAVYAVLPLGLGWRVETTAVSGHPPGMWVLLGALAVSSNLFMRVLHQKYKNEFPEQGTANSGRTSLASRVSGEAGLAGWMMPLLFASLLASVEHWFLILFSAFYCLAASAITLSLTRRVLLEAKRRSPA